jgi:hypothetical protein
MSHPRWAPGLVTATLAVAVLADVGYAAPASAADVSCASISLDGTPAVGAPVTASVSSGGSADGVRFTWSGIGFGRPVQGATFTARYDVVGAPVHLSVRGGSGATRVRAECTLDPVDWGHLARPAAPEVTGRTELGGILHATPDSGSWSRPW